ncbi:MAG: response regulator [Blastocatellales bacterium]|nr:response regulator [Blastocatellales bacterium]
MTSVLIVDDNADNLYLLRVLLQGCGFAVNEAANGAEALTIARRKTPGLVISDLLMPVMDGYTLLRHWKSDERLRSVPFIVFTATYTDPKDERLAMALGADDFIIKPAEPDVLMERVRDVLSKGSSARPHPDAERPMEDLTLLNEYNEVLVRKLEKKALQLERTNRELMDEIAERKRTEQALRESEERYRKLFHSIADPLFVYDRETLGCLAVNDAAVNEYGYSREEFLSMRIVDIRAPGDAGSLWKEAAGTDATAQMRGVSRHRRKNGEIIEVEMSTYELEFSGRPACLVQARNVTEQRKLEGHVRQGQKMEAVGRLAGGVAHDFNNLLTVINGYSDLLRERLAVDDPTRELLSEIHKAGERAGTLTRQLLAFSRQQVIEPKLLNLNSVVSDTEKLLRRLIGEDILLVTKLNPKLGRVKADPGQIEQVMMNLAVNARDAMPQGGNLTIETQMMHLDEHYCKGVADLNPGEYVMLAVSDSGCGMNQEVLARIFEPFFTTKNVGEGTGLGLATVHGIIKQSGGHIAVYSEQGYGTSFKIFLPQASGPTPGARPDPKSMEMPEGTETLLLVEDEDAVRMLASHILRACGYRVLEAANGRDALRLSESESGAIHLLISDVVMPYLGGRALAEQIAAARPGCRVMFLSGYTDDAVVRHGVLEAEFAFLQKPFTASSLAQKVRSVLDASRQTDS